MDQHDTSSMAHEAPTYPSPTGHQMGEGTHPFYSNQQPIPSAEEMSLQTRLSREVPPNMTDNIGDAQDIQRAEQVMQNLAQAQMHSPQQLAQGGLEPNQDANYGDGSAKKRSKVSRACDECRRKKVCTIFDRRMVAEYVSQTLIAQDSMRCHIRIRNRTVFKL